MNISQTNDAYFLKNDPLQNASAKDKTIASFGNRLTTEQKSFLLDEMDSMKKVGKSAADMKEFVYAFMKKHGIEIGQKKKAVETAMPQQHLPKSILTSEQKSFLLDEMDSMKKVGKSAADMKEFVLEFLADKEIEVPNKKGLFVNKMA